MVTTNYEPADDPMPTGLVDRMLTAVHNELDRLTA